MATEAVSPHALRRPSPHVQLRMALERAKADVQLHADFDAAWEWAFKQIIWPHDTVHRQQWRRALQATRIEWEACYLNRPTPTARLLRDFRPEVMFPAESGELLVA